MSSYECEVSCLNGYLDLPAAANGTIRTTGELARQCSVSCVEVASGKELDYLFIPTPWGNAIATFTPIIIVMFVVFLTGLLVYDWYFKRDPRG